MKLKTVGICATMCTLCMAFAIMLSGCGQSQDQKVTEPETISEEAADTTFEGITEPFYVLVVGNDSRTGTVEANVEAYADGSGRSDTIMLLRVDPINYTVGMVTIPRDTQCVYNGESHKINETYHQGGIEALKTAITELTGVEVKYYFDTGFVGYANFIDDIGGVDTCLPIDLSLKDILSGDKISLSAGEQTLSGAQALVASRDRKQYYSLGDVQRQRISRNIVQTIITHVANNPSSKDLYTNALYAVADSDFPKDQLSQLIDSFTAHADQLSFVSGTGPYDGGQDASTGEWYAIRDEATWKLVIAALENHTDPEAIVSTPEALPAE